MSCKYRGRNSELMNIVHDLVGLNRSVDDYPVGLGKEDKKYIKLEEFLTRCLIKFDGIERSSEVLIKTVKQLINFTNRLLAKLEDKARALPAPVETAESEAAKKKKNKKKSGAKQESVEESEEPAVTEKPVDEKKTKTEEVVEVKDVKIVEEEATALPAESIEEILKKKGKTKKPKK